MGSGHSTENNNSPDKNTIKQTSGYSSIDATACSPANARMMQNVRLVWLDSTIDEENNRDYQKNIKELRRIVHNIHTFTDQADCVTFLSTIKNEQVCIIISGSLGQQTVPQIHDMSHVDSIFIFCGDKAWHEKWATDWPKIKGVFIEIISICEGLKEATRQCEHNAIPISFMPATIGNAATNTNLDQLDSLFMYTQIIKEILLTIKFKQQHFNEFIDFCYNEFAEKDEELRNIEEFKREYRDQTPIWWYTSESFLFPMLNRALREMEMDIIIKIGFFITDLHRHIEQLHKKQFRRASSQQSFTLYRGQSLSDADLKKLQEANGSLISFNNFLSTSKNPNVALAYAQRAIRNKQLNGILFVITVDPSVSTTSFASINDVGYYGNKEDEVLFAMHTVFRIYDIKPSAENNRLCQVNLTLTCDNDQDLRVLTDYIRKETYPKAQGWYRLGFLLLKIGQSEKAHQVYQILLEQTTEDRVKVHIYNQLGLTKCDQGEYKEAIAFYVKALKIRLKSIPPTHPDLAAFYNNIGTVYKNMGAYSKALSSHEKALEIKQQSLPPAHPHLAASYNNIGTVYRNMGEYSKALLSHEKALEIRQQSLPSTHPDLATSYNNIGSVYQNMGEYSKALSSHEKALEIKQQSLPATHPSLATSYDNLGLAYRNMGEYSKALLSHEKTLEIRQQSLPSTHPSLATSYNNIGTVYENMGEYSKALLSHEKALEILQQSLPATHPSLATSYDNLGLTYRNMGEHSKALLFHEKALLFHEKALEILHQSLPSTHPSLATSYNNIGAVYENMDEYSKALSFHEKALEIKQQSLPPTHPHLAASFNDIGTVYRNMGEYSKALLSHEKALEILQQSLPSTHPDLATSYNNIGTVYEHMGEYSKALPSYESAVHIGQSLLPNHPELKKWQENLDRIRNKW